jgi:ribosomal protein L11 methyltransferase
LASTHRYDLPVDPADVDAVAARLWAAGAHGVWERPGRLSAWFAAPTDAVPGGGAWEAEPDRDWQAEWKAGIRPVRAGRFVIVPTWLADEHAPAAGDEVLVLDPGRAFGSGHHATTTLCLELLDELDLVGRRVADIGCGTGILAIAAARRGADVDAVDVDADAVEVTRTNAARNEVELHTAVGSVGAVRGRVDVVVANLVTDVVAELAPALVAAAGELLVVSGITVERQSIALDALTAAGMRVGTTRQRDGWVAVTGRPADRGGQVADPRPGAEG